MHSCVHVSEIDHWRKPNELVYFLSELMSKYSRSSEEHNSALGVANVVQTFLLSFLQHSVYKDRNVTSSHLIKSEVPVLSLTLIVHFVSLCVACFSAVSNPDAILSRLEQLKYQIFLFLIEEPSGPLISEAMHEEYGNQVLVSGVLV